MKTSIEMKLGFDPKALASRLLPKTKMIAPIKKKRAFSARLKSKHPPVTWAKYSQRKREKIRQSILAAVKGWEMEHAGVAALVAEESKASGVPARAIVSRCRLQPAVVVRFRVMHRASAELGLSDVELARLFHCTRWNVAYALGRRE